MSTTTTYALKLAAGGHPVLPLHGVDAQGHCTCRRRDCASPGKHPRLAHGLLEASSEPSVVAAWWRRWPSANLGLLTGEAADLLVIDIDGPEGVEAFGILQRRHGELPPTRWVRTGGHGWHAYLRWPGGRLGNSARKLGAGIDTRGTGGYVVAPPSLHVTGRRYEWANTERAAPCPGWLLELLRPPAPPPRPPTALAPRRGDYGGAALAAELTRVRMAPVGTRNHTLNTASFNLGQLVGSGLLDLHGVAGALLAAALTAGLGETEARRTIESGLVAGQATPRGRTA